MSNRDPRQHHEPEERTRYEESAHPDRTLDELEERVLGHRQDQERGEPDEDLAGAEPP